MKSLLLLVFSLTFLVSCKGEERPAGGIPANPAQFPFYVQFVIKRKTGRMMDMTYCGGSLIHRRFILSAAHCFPERKDLKHSLDQKWVRAYMGNVETFLPDESNIRFFVERVAAEVIIHSGYKIIHRVDYTYGSGEDELSVQNDVSIVALKRGYDFLWNLQPLNLPARSEIGYNERCAIGIFMGAGGPQNTHLMYTWAKTLDHQELSNPNMYRPSTEMVFFAQQKFEERHAMEAESGGPLVCYLNSVAVQYGIASTIRRNGTTKIMVHVFEDVTKHMGFIKHYVKYVPQYYHAQGQPLWRRRTATTSKEVGAKSSAHGASFGVLSIELLVLVKHIHGGVL